MGVVASILLTFHPNEIVTFGSTPRFIAITQYLYIVYIDVAGGESEELRNLGVQLTLIQPGHFMPST